MVALSRPWPACDGRPARRARNGAGRRRLLVYRHQTCLPGHKIHHPPAKGHRGQRQERRGRAGFLSHHNHPWRQGFRGQKQGGVRATVRPDHDRSQETGYPGPTPGRHLRQQAGRDDRFQWPSLGPARGKRPAHFRHPGIIPPPLR